jgi:hypothetical protein
MKYRLLIAFLIAPAIAACGDNQPGAPIAVASVSISAPATSIAVGGTLQFDAVLLDAQSRSLGERPVSWISSDISVARVDGSGLVTGVAPGVATIRATSEGRSGQATVTVFGTAASCDGVAPIELAVGEIRRLSGAQRNLICIPAGALESEYTLIPFFATPVPSATLQVDVAGMHLVAVDGISATVQLARSAGGAQLAGTLQEPVRDANFDAALRELERRELQPRIGDARAALGRGITGLTLSRTAAEPPAVGSTLKLNAQAGSACLNESVRTGRIAAISERAIIVADTANPVNGFTTNDYAAFAATFDTLVYPVVTGAFGAPSDIDGNARSLIFFTRAVNELTPRNSQSMVGGFFFARDLFPRTGTNACAGSNEAEVFYMLVPDPTGVVNGNVRQTEMVRQRTVGVLAHEFQHLINAGRRMFVNSASGFEEAWLNEGLSHIAEELLFYRAAGLEPGANIDSTRLRATSRTLAAVNAYQLSNLGRLSLYLGDPEENSPFAAGDELATRGAAWQLLRYAADQRPGDENTIWYSLVNTRNAGFSNLAAVFGEPLPIIRDWATAQYTDDLVAGGTGTFSHPSWNFRSVLALLSSNSNRFPLRLRPLADATPQRLTLVGGGAAYIRFAVPAGATGIVRATSGNVPLPGTVDLTLVRTK